MKEIRNQHRVVEMQLPAILNQLNAGIAQTDITGRFVDMNDRFCSMTGYSREELVNLTMMDITHPDDLDENVRMFNNCVATGENFFIDKRFVRKDGSTFWVNDNVSLIEESGKKYVTAISVDITDRRDAEKQVQESQERYQNFIHRSTEGIWRFEVDEPIPVNFSVEEQIECFYTRGFLAECNDAMAKMYGFEQASELTGARVHQFFERDETAIAYFTAFIESGYQIQGAESKEFDRKGNVKYFLNNLIGVVEDGMLIRAWGTQRDITEFKVAQDVARRAREESDRQRRLYETIAGSTPDLIYVFDLNYRFTYANQALLNMWGKTWRQAVGRNLLENGYEPWHAEMHEREIDRVVATREPIRGQVSFPHATLGARVYDYIFAPVLNDKGEVEAIAGTTRDITEITMAEKSLKESEERYRTLAQSLEQLVTERTKELKRSNNDLQQFAHVASHDLKEPLRKLRIFGDRLKTEYSDVLPDQAKIYLKKMESAADRMHSMIEGVLLYSSLNALQSAPQPIDLNSVIEDVKTDLEVAIENRNATIISENLPYVSGTPILIYQLFYNLVNNCLKFSRSGVAPRVEITSTTLEGDYVKVIIKDNGIGFNSDEAEEIFGAFKRLHGKDQYEGTGLGLALCRNIVERHHGTISADGKRGEGAVFTFTLPLSKTLP